MAVFDRHYRCRVSLSIFVGGKLAETILESGSPVGLVRKLGEHRAEVLIYALHDPSEFEREWLEQLQDQHPDLRILLLADDPASPALGEALKTGVSGILRRGVDPDILIGAIQQICGGGVIVDRALVEMLQRPASQSQTGRSPNISALDALTDRDQYILAAIVQGKSNAEIGERLHLSSGTVGNLVMDLYRRMGVSRRAEAAYVAARLGLVHREAPSATGIGESIEPPLESTIRDAS